MTLRDKFGFPIDAEIIGSPRPIPNAISPFSHIDASNESPAVKAILRAAMRSNGKTLMTLGMARELAEVAASEKAQAVLPPPTLADRALHNQVQRPLYPPPPRLAQPVPACGAPTPARSTPTPNQSARRPARLARQAVAAMVRFRSGIFHSAIPYPKHQAP